MKSEEAQVPERPRALTRPAGSHTNTCSTNTCRPRVWAEPRLLPAQSPEHQPLRLGVREPWWPQDQHQMSPCVQCRTPDLPL